MCINKNDISRDIDIEHAELLHEAYEIRSEICQYLSKVSINYMKLSNKFNELHDECGAERFINMSENIESYMKKEEGMTQEQINDLCENY